VVAHYESFVNEMKRRVAVSLFATILLVAIVLLVAIGVTVSSKREPAPGDFSYWAQAVADKDWSVKAAQGDPEAQFCVGLMLVRTNLVKFINRIPLLSDVPVVGRRFKKIGYSIDNNIGQDQMAEAFTWIKKSADQSYSPAKEAEKLFVGRVAEPAGRTNLTHAEHETDARQFFHKP